jgi:hypothetical protein
MYSEGRSQNMLGQHGDPSIHPGGHTSEWQMGSAARKRVHMYEGVGGRYCDT